MRFKMLVLLIVLSGCGRGVDDLVHLGVCEAYPPWDSSAYVLPYAPGESVRLSQGNCSGASHNRQARYAYDFDLAIGSEIYAARGGEVVDLVESNEDGNGCAAGANFLQIRHDDGSLALYVHLTKNGVVPDVGDTVTQGALVAYSGNTGCSSGAHLHFEVLQSEGGESIPVTFRNTEANPRGLKQDKTYLAE